MEWISIKDKLPKDRQEILIFEDECIYLGNYVNGEFLDCVMDEMSGDYYRCPLATHWMETPKHPTL